MRLTLLFLLLGLPRCFLGGQSLTTAGDQSPLIQATKSTLTYENSVHVEHSVPMELLPLVAGILLTNDVEVKQSQQALEVWMGKYRELDKAINELTDTDLIGRARVALSKGDFPAVEKLLRLRGNFAPLINQFPRTYGLKMNTSGEQSPIVIADVSEITYVVHRVIQYKLPEQLTTELLKKLKNNIAENEQLRTDLKSRDQIVAEWIAKYREVEKLLAESPSAIAQRAQTYFQNGQLDSTLLVLQELDGTKLEIARSCYLQARIQMLRFDPIHFDSLKQEIYVLLRQSVALEENPEVMFSYGVFLAETVNDYPLALQVLTRAKAIAETPLRKLQVESQLAYVQGSMQQFGAAEQHARTALQLADALENPLDTFRLVAKNQSIGVLANSIYQQAISNYNTTNQAGPQNNTTRVLIERAIQYDSLCLLIQDSLDQYSRSPLAWRLPNRFIALNNLVNRVRILEDSTIANRTFKEVLKFMEINFRENPSMLAWYYAQAILNYSNFQLAAGLPKRAERTLSDALELTRYFQPEQNITSYFGLRGIYTSLVTTTLYNRRPNLALEYVDSLFNRFEGYRNHQIVQPDNYLSEIETFRSYLAFRTAHYPRGITAANSIIDIYARNPTPAPAGLQAAINGFAISVWAGCVNAIGAEDYPAARQLIVKAQVQMDRMRGVLPQAQSYIDAVKARFELLNAQVDLRAGLLDAAEVGLAENLAEVNQLVQIDALNSLNVYFSNLLSQGELYELREEKESAIQLYRSLLDYFDQKLPANYQQSFGQYMMLCLGRLLSVRAGKKAELESWANRLEELIQLHSTNAAERTLLYRSNILQLDMDRLYRAEAAADLLGYWNSLPSNKQPEWERTCRMLVLVSDNLPEAYQDYYTVAVRNNARPIASTLGCQ